MTQKKPPDILDGEEWRPIPSFPKYHASNLGRIRGARGWVMSPRTPPDGYPQLNLMRDGKLVTKDVHVLVCEAFHGLRPSPKHESAHADGVRHNSAADNLRWATRAENVEDKKEHGTWPKHEVHPRATITMEIADVIRRQYTEVPKTRRGRTPKGWCKEMAMKHGTTKHVIRGVLQGKCWV